MGILELLGLGRAGAPPETVSESRHGDTETVRRIVGELGRLDRSRAPFLGAFAFVLSRVAAADRDINTSETDKMIEIVQRLGHIPEEQAVLVVAITGNQNQLFGSTEDYLVTWEFPNICTDEQRHELLDCLFAVLAADDTITGDEEEQIRQISSELGLSHREYIKAHLAYTDKRSVFKRKG
ncbi:MAG: TerB family tellurite resistance protein [Acidobacteria bacterium]|nr:TerB family tellurite resistance protein [Candidatus Sulfomarinibacter kjeldsenii]